MLAGLARAHMSWCAHTQKGDRVSRMKPHNHCLAFIETNIRKRIFPFMETIWLLARVTAKHLFIILFIHKFNVAFSIISFQSITISTHVDSLFFPTTPLSLHDYQGTRNKNTLLKPTKQIMLLSIYYNVYFLSYFTLSWGTTLIY